MDPRHRQLLEPRTRIDRVGGRVVAVLWVLLWVAILFVLADAVASWIGGGAVVRVWAPAALSLAWVVFAAVSWRRQARRERRVREEFTD